MVLRVGEEGAQQAAVVGQLVLVARVVVVEGEEAVAQQVGLLFHVQAAEMRHGGEVGQAVGAGVQVAAAQGDAQAARQSAAR